MGILEQFSLNERVALVTGSSRGLGWAIAQALAEAGAHVVLNGRSAATVEPRAQELAARGLAASISTFDVNDPKGPVDGVAAIAEKHGRLDILVNNAGIVRRALAVDTTDAAWQAVLDTDLTACFRMSREAAKPMIKRRWGRIINISSVMGTFARPTIASYVASKAGIHGLTRALAVELMPHGITVNCIGPGFYPSQANEIVRKDQKFYDWVCGRTPAGRWGDPRELGGAAVYFASEASSYCNGQVLTIDGGMVAAM